MYGHKSTAIAKRLLDIASENKNPLTPMQVLKLVYLCHGWMLGLYGRPLICEEVQAWRYGPVIPELYHKIKEFRSHPVEVEALEENLDVRFDQYESSIIEDVYKIYGHLDGIQLSSLTHAEGTPWSIAWKMSAYRNTIISNDIIEHHFSELAKERSSV